MSKSERLKPIKRYRVRNRSRSVSGWAYPDRERKIYGVRNSKAIRTEIYVVWDHTWPDGYINKREIIQTYEWKK